jgi:predicted permease
MQAREDEIQRELRAHLELEVEEQAGSGVSSEEAHYRALRAFGNVTRVIEDTRAVWSPTCLWQVWQDMRYAIRALRRNPGFTAVAVLSLSIGIGANAAVFSLIHAILLQDLAYRDPNRLVAVTGLYPKGAIADLRRESRSMDIVAYTPDSESNLVVNGEAEHLGISMVSANLFSLLGVEAQLGRTPHAWEDQPGQDRVVVLSDALWRTKLEADPNVLGRLITLDGVTREVIGVMPRNFAFPSSNVALWVPLHMEPTNTFEFWNTGFIPLIGRLRPGATLQKARDEMGALIAHAITAFPYPMPHSWNAEATVVPLQRFLVSNVRTKLLVLQCAVALVLLIACANVASLLLARGAVRHKEMTLRSALGASRGRIVRQLLTESVVLGLAGTVVGLGLAYGALATLKFVLPANTPGWSDIRINLPVLGFVTVVSIGCAIAFGLAPTLASTRFCLADALPLSGQRSTSSAGTRLRALLITGEFALAVVLAVSAGLLIRSLWILANVNPGFSTEQVLTLRVSPDASSCWERSRCVALYNQLLQRARGITGVGEIAASNAVPLSGQMNSIPAEMEDHLTKSGDALAPMLWASAVTPQYFNLMRIPVLKGRSFSESDSENSELVVLVSASTAARFWPGQDPISKHVRPVWGQQPWRTVVGVVGDVRQYQLSSSLPGWVAGAVYMPYPQAVGNDRQLPAAMTLLVRTGTDRQRVTSEIRRLVAELNPNAPVSEVRPLEALVSFSDSQQRAMMWLFVSFAAAAVLLAAIGIYGVVSFLTAQRMYEMGVRLALGATRGNLFGLVIKLSLQLAMTGLVCGIVLAMTVTRILTSLLYGVHPNDGLTFLSAIVLLVSVAILAGLIPARRAARVNPMTVLRAE